MDCAIEAAASDIAGTAQVTADKSKILTDDDSRRIKRNMSAERGVYLLPPAA
jgi:hypothetical protein